MENVLNLENSKNSSLVELNDDELYDINGGF